MIKLRSSASRGADWEMDAFIHKYQIAKYRLEHEFGLEVICMPNALKGSAFTAKNPQLRARDLEEMLRELPVFYNVNFSHAKPIGVIPYGGEAELDCENKTITLLECPTV